MNLFRLTAAKAVANTALRWAPPFLPVLEKAFGTTTGQMTTILGVGEMAGLSTVSVGKFLDRGKERLVMTVALALISIASLVALIGTTFTFAIGFVMVILGVANCTVAGHAYISSRVDYSTRARSIGLYETSWAFALIIGAPVIAVLIGIFGWRGPYGMLAVAAALMALLIWRSPETPRLEQTATSTPEAASSTPDGHINFSTHAAMVDIAALDAGSNTPGIGALTPQAWAVIVGSSLLALSGLSVFAISGTWLDDAFGVSTGGLGAVAMGFGALELLGSMASAGFADRIGKFRSTVIGTVLLVAGLGIMSRADSTLWIGIVGILIFLCGFEFGFVTSLSLVTEAMPEARGTTIALSSGVGTVARGGGTIASGALYTSHGVSGTLGLSLIAALLSVAAFTFSRRARA
ncbi:MAG: DHA1 family inner membrane transport protein [Ilumatobacter sp.]